MCELAQELLLVFANSYFIALCVPIALLLCSAVAKKLVRGSSWKRQDFFLGVEFSLTAIASGLLHIFDLNKMTATDATLKATLGTAGFVVLCFFLLLVVLAVHQDWEKRTQDRRGQIIWLGIISNIIGAGLLFVFSLAVKGV